MKEHKLSSSLSQSYQQSTTVQNKTSQLKEWISRSVQSPVVPTKADRLINVENIVGCLPAYTRNPKNIEPSNNFLDIL